MVVPENAGSDGKSSDDPLALLWCAPFSMVMIFVPYSCVERPEVSGLKVDLKMARRLILISLAAVYVCLARCVCVCVVNNF